MVNCGVKRQYCGITLLMDLAVMMRIDPLVLFHGLREFVSRRTGESVQELDVVRQFSLSGRLFSVKLGGTEETERTGQ